MSAKFKVGQPVIYVNGDTCELGIVKKVIPPKVSGPYDFPPDEDNNSYDYFVNYHMGDTAARTCERDLHALINEYAFKIERLLVD